MNMTFLLFPHTQNKRYRVALNLKHIGPHGVSPLVSGKLSQIPSFPPPPPHSSILHILPAIFPSPGCGNHLSYKPFVSADH